MGPTALWVDWLAELCYNLGKSAACWPGRQRPGGLLVVVRSVGCFRMRLRTIIVAGAFVLALLGGLTVGLRLLSDDAGLTRGPLQQSAVLDSDVPAKWIEGTIVSASDGGPGTWALDPKFISGDIIAFEVGLETEIITNGATIRPGLWARVELLSLPDGVHAKTIELQPNPRSITVEGRLTLTDDQRPGLWALGPYAFAVVSETQIEANGIRAEPGVWARVEMRKLPPNVRSISQREAKAMELLKPKGDQGPPLELVDRVTLIDGAADQLRVGNTQVFVVSPGVIPSGLQEGDLVMARGTWASEGIAAEEIQRLTEGREVGFQGEILAIGASSWRMRSPQGPEITVQVQGALIEGDPAAGRLAQVQGLETGPGQVDAFTIRVVPSNGPEELVGWLEGIDGAGEVTTWRVTLVDDPQPRPAQLLVGPNTFVDESATEARPQAWLEIVAAPQSGGVYAAQSIRVLANPPKRVVQGVVEQLPAGGLLGTWQVAGYRVIVTGDTGIKGVPSVGAFVWINGYSNYDATVTADLVEVVAD